MEPVAEPEEQLAGMVVLIVVMGVVTAIGVCHGVYFRMNLSHEYLEMEEAAKFNADRRHADFELVGRDGERLAMDRRYSEESLEVI
ncbi:Hypothetical Protein FCC1311_101052 [Hondaea fermentalgiana]|uniref:Uncharacterized protein n=1 Tax=Hondaea fermentalgiana TaxID=2315210 RepID=A0A2R5GSP2_9STRA|nr:Hypothetical Protein FCC1311_101052 [Hondaea fermentalgiana]|eukprot:GBG33882.1 Hypothetical Protein FCC1311_101052 [Hondaea fermentalgiana]